ncbi:hypothetical protein NQ117_03450 [Paenibacillus sp. SC116]|uniref:hypothetical protein n=1 Tax=Paenibacillus sp. SC116 TaxID=2968986 RepID=UPI00215A8E46|nr:hypothetical protein [Paenibacillus sp. SC116]MCR8842726.1 hypothetical protein [Paenibacillus sp. SC116]
MKFSCPICGYDGLREAAYDEDNSPSYQICGCCGVEYGVDDEEEGFNAEEYRNAWIKKGMPWYFSGYKPLNWDCNAQLRKVNFKTLIGDKL